MQRSAKQILETLDDLLRRNDYISAEQYLTEQLRLAKQTQNDEIILLMYNELMGLSRKLGKEVQALTLVDLALEQIKQMNIENNVGAATTLLNCATVYKAFAKAESSLPLFEKAKEIYHTRLSPDDPRLAGLYNNMGLTMVDLKRFDEAMALYRDALAVLRRHSHTAPEMAITYLNMATAAEGQYGLLDAESAIADYLKQAVELLDACQHRQDGNYAFVCEKCASVFGYYGYFWYENELKQRCRRIYEGS